MIKVVNIYDIKKIFKKKNNGYKSKKKGGYIVRMKRTINELVEIAHNNSVNHGFWEKERNFGEVIALMHTELSEAFEEYRHGRGFNETYYENGTKPCGIPSELADVVIRIFDFCGGNDIDLEKIILEKMEYNETRPYKHGEKKC